MNAHESQPSHRGAPRKQRRGRYRRAVIVSIALHAIGALVLLSWYLPNREPSSPDSTALKAAQPSPQGQGDADLPSPPTPPPAPEIPADQIEASIESQISQIENLPDERKLSELEKNLKRLDKVASPESVQEVTTTIASTLGLDDQTYQPKESVGEGAFDPSTAQIQDVVRTESENGQWTYESVLVDAEGRTAKVPMSSEDGQTMYETFQQMKKFPMAEGIYRSIVMPLIQKTIDAADAAKQAALAAERAANENQ
tara:strand:- start:434588 stop:435352 length:765 start_codon:yes stop_codon:yes gene_type:complete